MAAVTPCAPQPSAQRRRRVAHDDGRAASLEASALVLGRGRGGGEDEASGGDVVDSAVADGEVGAQAAGELPACAAPVHVGRAAQRWGGAVEDAGAQAGDQVQPGREVAAQDVADLAAFGHRPADDDREPDHRAGVGFALGLVGVQRVLAEVAADDAGEFPRQVVGVAQPGAQALPDERGGQVRGVAEQEHPAGAPPVGELGAEGVLGDPHEAQLRRVEVVRPGPQQRQQRVQVRVVAHGLAVAQAELPAVAGRPDPHVGGGPGRVADLVDAVPGVEVRRGVDVDDEPALLEPQARASERRSRPGRRCWLRRSPARSRRARRWWRRWRGRAG